MTARSRPALGCGVGLRGKHYPVITNEWPRMDWFEAISENYMDSGGRPIQILEKVRHHYPIALHGTSLSIGSTDPLNPQYLTRLKKLIERIDPFIVSDHLCWSGIGGEHLHDLLPLPFTEEALQHVVQRVEYLQEFLGRRILLENVSTYVTFRHSTIPEWEFLREVAKRSGCGILFDVNNLYVNAKNHNFDPHEYLRNIPAEYVGQIHLAGHTDMGSFLFDTHSASVIEAVWDLYREALSLWGPVSTLIEWDENIPDFPRLAREADKARQIYKKFEGEKLAEHASKRISLAHSFLQNVHPQTSLLESQQWMQSRIRPLKQTPQTESVSETLLNPQGGVSGEERMSVYAKGYKARIREGLGEVYETIQSLLEPEIFSQLSNDYAVRYPSHSYNLNLVGEHLPELLATHPLKERFPFLPDLARLEWLIYQSFHAFDGKPLEPSDIASIPMEDWESARIVFQPSVALLASPWPILDIRQLRHEKTLREAAENIRPEPQKILISRKEVQVRCELLEENQFRLLEGLLAGKTLGFVCEEIAAHLREEILPLAEWFSRWIHDGLILRCEFSEKTTPQPCC